MALRPLQQCMEAGCTRLTRTARCDEHIRAYPSDDNRLNSHQRGYTNRWHKARRTYLARNPMCVHCLAAGRSEPATQVDHIVPHRGDQELFWRSTNWQALCASCHSRKTAAGR